MYKGIYYQPAMSGTELQLRKNVCELAKQLSPLEISHRKQTIDERESRLRDALRTSIKALLGGGLHNDFFRDWDSWHHKTNGVPMLAIENYIAGLDWTQFKNSEQYLPNLDWSRYATNMREQERIFHLKGYFEVTDRWPDDMTIQRIIRIFKDGPHDLEIYHHDQFGEKPSAEAIQAFNERAEKLVESMEAWLEESAQ